MFGQDIEQFVFEKDGTLVPAFNINFRHFNQKVLYDSPIKASRDNVMWEQQDQGWNDPSQMADAMMEYLEKIHNRTRFTVKRVAEVALHKNLLDNKLAHHIGCAPYQNYYSDSTIKLSSSDLSNVRTGSGHVHMECDDPHCILLCDVFLGLVQTALVDPKYHQVRLKHYGQAGNFRHRKVKGKSVYEYRTLSNWWTFEWKYVFWIGETVQLIQELVKGDYSLYLDHVDQAKDVINSSDIDTAKSLINKLELPVPSEV